MRSRSKVIVTLLIFMVLLTGCTQSTLNGKTKEVETKNDKRPLLLNYEKESVLVYFTTEDGKYLVPVTLPIKPTKEAAKVAVEKVLAGSESWSLANTIPEETKLNDIYINNNKAYIDLTEQFLNQDSYNNVEMAVKSLVLTLTEFREVEEVQFLVDGKIADEIQGFKINNPFPRPESINNLKKIADNEECLNIYFSDINALYMIPISYGINKNSTTAEILDKAVKELIKGPSSDSNLNKTFWKGTKVKSIKYDAEEKIAVVDFSQELIGYGGGSAMEIQLLNSILFTLTDIDDINSVQILIEGEKVKHLPEGSNIFDPLPRPDYLNYINI